MGSTECLAGIFVTTDGGRHWVKQDPKPRLPILSSVSWPVEQFASLVLPSVNVIVLAWDDPWLFDGSKSHVICSQDCGESWKIQLPGLYQPLRRIGLRRPLARVKRWLLHGEPRRWA